MAVLLVFMQQSSANKKFTKHISFMKHLFDIIFTHVRCLLSPLLSNYTEQMSLAVTVNSKTIS